MILINAFSTSECPYMTGACVARFEQNVLNPKLQELAIASIMAIFSRSTPFAPAKGAEDVHGKDVWLDNDDYAL